MPFDQAALVDRIQIKLSDEQKAKLTHWITQERDRIDDARGDFVNRQKTYLANFDDFITEITKGPWEGSLNLHMPLTAIMVKSYHARLYNIFTAQDTVNLVPREPMDERLVAKLSMLRNWYLWDYINEYRGIKGVVNELFYDVVTVGYGIIMKSWDLVQRKYLEIVPKELEREMTELEPQMAEAQKTGEKVRVAPYKEVQKIITHYEGSKLITVPFENAYFPNTIPEVSDMNFPPMVLISTEMSGSTLKLKAAQGEYDKEAVDKVLERRASTDPDKDSVKQTRSNLTGFDDYYYRTETEIFDIEYCFCRYDIDEDGIGEEIVVTRDSTGEILKVTYLDRISKSGNRPLYKFDCFTKARQSYSRGVPEYLYPLQMEMDKTHNMRLDYMELAAMPWGVFKGSSTLDQKPIAIQPGKFIPVEETTDIRTMSFSSTAFQLSQDEDRGFILAERLVGVSPLTQGIVPQNVGPTRSTSGVITMLNQMEKEFRPVVDHNAVQWKKLEKAIHEDLDIRVDPYLKMRVLGATVEDFKQLTSMEDPMTIYQKISLNANFDVFVNVADAINSDEVRRNDASVILQVFGAPSLLQQFGIVTPMTLYNVAREYLRAYGKNPDLYLTPPADMLVKPLTLYQEIQICGQGEIPPMSAMDDHFAKAQGMAEFIRTPEFLEAVQKGLYVPNVVDYVMMAVKKHAGLAEALRPKGMPNTTGAQGINYAEQQSGNAPQQKPGEKTTEREGTAPSGGETPPPSGEQPAGVGGTGQPG